MKSLSSFPAMIKKIKFFPRKVMRFLAYRTFKKGYYQRLADQQKLDFEEARNADKELQRTFHSNQIKLEEAKSIDKELVDIMPGIDLPMVIHPDMYFCRAYTTAVFERDSLDFIRKYLKPGQTVLDVGANVGYFSLFFSKLVTPIGRVIAFEPGEFPFNLLKRNKELNQLENLAIYQAGLGKRDEIVDFNAGESGMEVYNSLGDIVHFAADPNQFKKVKIQLFEGASWLASHNINHIDLMKLDVEGGEYFVLNGMLKMFQSQQISRLLIEMSYDLSQALGYYPSDIILMLKKCGYNWFRLRSRGQIEPLLGNDIGIPGMFVAVSSKCMNKG